jgi:hypothetical protein
MAESRPTNPVTMRDAERLVKAARRVLLNGGYPNPERVGCLGPEALKGLAQRRIDLASAKDWLQHLGCCSPCFIEYTQVRNQTHRRKVFEYSLASAALVVLIAAGMWLWSGHRILWFGEKANIPVVAAYKPITLDLRNWMVFRGEQPPSAHSGPVHLPRGRLDLTVSLPLGSEAGNYVVQISTELGKTLVTATGTAAVRKDGVTALKVRLDDSKLTAGAYVLGIGKIGREPRAYPLEIR